MDLHFNGSNIIIFLSVILYFIYDFFEGKRIKDEREELIKLKTFEFVQRANTFTLLALSMAYFFTPYINGVLIICILILSSLYTEIGARFYYRKKF